MSLIFVQQLSKHSKLMCNSKLHASTTCTGLVYTEFLPSEGHHQMKFHSRTSRYKCSKYYHSWKRGLPLRL